jgi:hypothetical protein
MAPSTIWLSSPKGGWDGDRLIATGHLSIPYVKWGLKDPSILFLTVAKKVELDIATAGHVTWMSSDRVGTSPHEQHMLALRTRSTTPLSRLLGFTHGLLMIARHPRTRRAIINSLERHPGVFQAIMDGAMRKMLSAV